jgi:hypothetical protein
MAQLVVAVQILVSGRQAVDALGQHLLHAVTAPIPRPEIGETGRQPPDQADAPAGLPRQQRPGAGGDCAAVEVGHHGPRTMGFKLEAGLITPCHSRSRDLLLQNC